MKINRTWSVFGSVFPTFLLLLVLAFSGDARATLAERFQAARREYAPCLPTKANQELATELQKYQYVLWEGINNELLPGYFEVQIKCLKNLAPQAPVTVVAPHSYVSIADTATLEVDQLGDLFMRNGGLPIVILSHSKGSAEALLTLMRYPSLVESGIVAHAILLQGEFQGNPLTDLLTPIEALFGFGGWAFLSGHDDGPRSLSPEVEPQLMAAAFSGASISQVRKIHSVVKYVRSSQENKKIWLPLKASGLILSGYGANDGVILTSHQLLPGIGKDLGVLDGDHHDFVSGEPNTNSTAHFKEAFTKAVFAEVLCTPK